MITRGHIDLTQPSAGRIQDYLLGGTHNFEIDRLMGERIKDILPERSNGALRQRALLARAVSYFVRDLGLEQIIDFGSSLPTCNNTHQVAHAINPNVRIIYSDIDPLTVRYSREILGDTPNVRYLWCDAANPETLLESPEAATFFGDNHCVGIVFTLLAHFMDSDGLANSASALYEWADPGSYMIICSVGGSMWRENRESQVVSQKLSTPVKFRELEELLALLSPWELTEEGVVNNYDWGLPEEERQAHQETRAWSFVLQKR